MTQIFKKEVSAKTTTIVFGVLIIACLFAFYVSAEWNEPGCTPPNCNVPAPINTGSTDQIKEGSIKAFALIASEFRDSSDETFYLNLSAMSKLGGPIGIAPTGSSTVAIEASGDIKITNGARVYYHNGTAGKTLPCGTGKVLKDISISGGIITGGTCADYQTGGGTPTDASYVVLGLNSTLTAERVLTAGKGISITDAGANGNLTLGLMNCATNQIVKYNSSGQWACAADESGGVTATLQVAQAYRSNRTRTSSDPEYGLDDHNFIAKSDFQTISVPSGVNASDVFVLLNKVSPDSGSRFTGQAHIQNDLDGIGCKPGWRVAGCWEAADAWTPHIFPYDNGCVTNLNFRAAEVTITCIRMAP